MIFRRRQEPEPPTDPGLKLALAPEGNPLALNTTVPEKPFKAATVQSTWAKYRTIFPYSSAKCR